MIQPENWRGARDPARELEGVGDAGNSLVQNIKPVWYRPKSTGTGPEPVPAQIPPEPVTERNRNSGRVLVCMRLYSTR